MSFCCHCCLLCSGVFCATLLFLKWEGCPWSGCCFPVLAFMELMKRTGNLEQSHTAKCNFSKYANKSWLKACLWYSFWLKRSWLKLFYTPVCYCEDISMPLNMTRHTTKRDWLLSKCVQNISHSTVCISLFCRNNFEECCCPNNFDCWVDFMYLH